MVLPRQSTPGVDLANPRHRSELKLDEPVVESLQFKQPFRLLGRRAGRPAILEGVLIDLAKRRRDRPEPGLKPIRNARLRLIEPLVDQLAGKIGVDAILEDDRHQRESEL